MCGLRIMAMHKNSKGTALQAISSPLPLFVSLSPSYSCPRKLSFRKIARGNPYRKRIGLIYSLSGPAQPHTHFDCTRGLECFSRSDWSENELRSIPVILAYCAWKSSEAFLSKPPHELPKPKRFNRFQSHVHR